MHWHEHEQESMIEWADVVNVATTFYFTYFSHLLFTPVFLCEFRLLFVVSVCAFWLR